MCMQQALAGVSAILAGKLVILFSETWSTASYIVSGSNRYAIAASGILSTFSLEHTFYGLLAI